MSERVSIVLPVFNESAVIAGVAEELTRDVADRLADVQLVLVDDASTDGTGAILDRLAEADPRVSVFHAERNRGHGPSLRAGFDGSDGDWIFQIDADGQQVAAEFWDLWAEREHADLVMGVRRTREDGRHRAFVSAAARRVTRRLGGGDIRDVNVPFKLFRRSVWEDLRPDVPAKPVAISILVALGAALRGWRIAQVSISHRPRRGGESTVNLRALMRLSSGAVREMLRFRSRVRRRAPLAPQPSSRSASASSIL